MYHVDEDDDVDDDDDDQPPTQATIATTQGILNSACILKNATSQYYMYISGCFIEWDTAKLPESYM